MLCFRVFVFVVLITVFSHCESLPGEDSDVPLMWVPIAVGGTRPGEGGGGGTPDPQIELCLIDWNPYWREPHRFGKHKMVQQAACKSRKKAPLSQLKREALAAGAPLSPAGFIFHMSRVGSTLAANILASSPERLVYSEGFRMPCNGCSRKVQVALIRDLVLVYGASTSHAAMYFKFQSAMTPMMDLLLEAFPDTPWAFLFRSPTQVVQAWAGSHGFLGAVCTQAQAKAPKAVCNILAQAGVSTPCNSAPPAQYCAAHLARMADAALVAYAHDAEAVAAAPGRRPRGLLLEYTALPGAALPRGGKSVGKGGGKGGGNATDAVLLRHFGLHELLQGVASRSKGSQRTAAAMRGTAAQYSKGKRPFAGGGFTTDSSAKDAKASAAVKAASAAILEPRYARLQRASAESLRQFESEGL